MKGEKSKNPISTRVSKYVVIGIILTLFNFLIYTLIARYFIKNNDLLWVSSLIGYVCATILAFFLHSRITWQERHPSKLGVFNFFAWNFFTALVISPFCTWLFHLITPFYRLIFNISTFLHLPFDYEFIESTTIFVLVGIITMILNYLFYDNLVFGKYATKTPRKVNHEK